MEPFSINVNNIIPFRECTSTSNDLDGITVAPLDHSSGTEDEMGLEEKLAIFGSNVKNVNEII